MVKTGDWYKTAVNIVDAVFNITIIAGAVILLTIFVIAVLIPAILRYTTLLLTFVPD